MNNQSITRTNQKLTTAKQHFACLVHLDLESPKLLVNAYHEGVVFQLYLACNSFAQEIAEDFQVDVTKEVSFATLADILENKSTPNAQCCQLAILQVNKESWLCWLLDRYEKCWQSSNQSSIQSYNEADLQAQQLLINVRNISERSVDEWLQQCINELGQIIAEYRELMQEW